MQRSTLTYPVDYTVLETRVNAQRLEPCRDLEISYLYDYKIKVEILNIQINRSKAQITNGVSEILLNWKGIPQTDNAVGEDMTYSLWRHSVYAISIIKEWMEWKININVNPLDYVGFFMDWDLIKNLYMKMEKNIGFLRSLMIYKNH